MSLRSFFGSHRPISDGLPEGWRQHVRAWAVGNDRIHELHLFGSRAKGKYVEASDVDLAYILTGSDPGEVLAFSICQCGKWQHELQGIFDVPVQLALAEPGQDVVVWPAVLEHGQLIYRKAGYSPVE
jgi:predicted nucleotidyltransferase